MSRRLIFILVWMVTGLATAAVISLLGAALVPRPSSPDEQPSEGLVLIYIGFALMPWVGMAVFLALGLLGKLPGTKRTCPNDNS